MDLLIYLVLMKKLVSETLVCFDSLACLTSCRKLRQHETIEAEKEDEVGGRLARSPRFRRYSV